MGIGFQTADGQLKPLRKRQEAAKEASERKRSLERDSFFLLSSSLDEGDAYWHVLDDF